MDMKRFFKTARVGMNESLKEYGMLLGALFGWMVSCVVCSVIIMLIMQCIPGESCEMLFILEAFLGIAVGTMVYAFISRVKETMRIVDETGVSIKEAWRKADHDSCGEFM